MVMPRHPSTLSVPAPEAQISRNVLVSSAEVLALFATPKTLLEAPGANFAYVFEGALIHKPAGTAYAGIAAGEDITIKYTSQAGAEVGSAETTGFLDQATAQSRFIRAQTAATGVSDKTPVANAPLVLALLVGEIITGDSPLHVRVYYRIVPMTAFAS
jgi:hypothetical protein